MAGTPDLVDRVVAATSWNARVALIRRVPEVYGIAQHQGVYASIAQRVYAPSLSPDFGYVHWREGYELEPLFTVYGIAEAATAGFANVSVADIARTIRQGPTTLRVFRLMLGLTTGEFAEATRMIGTGGVSKARVGSIEGGSTPSQAQADLCATVIDRMMRGDLFPPGAAPLRRVSNFLQQREATLRELIRRLG